MRLLLLVFSIYCYCSLLSGAICRKLYSMSTPKIMSIVKLLLLWINIPHTDTCTHAHTHTQNKIHSVLIIIESEVGAEDFAFCLFRHTHKLNKYVQCFSHLIQHCRTLHYNSTIEWHSRHTHTLDSNPLFLIARCKKCSTELEREVNAWKLLTIPFIIALWLLHENEKLAPQDESKHSRLNQWEYIWRESNT